MAEQYGNQNQDSDRGNPVCNRGCQGFRSLKMWQVAQYRRAVEENKWYLSERCGHEVGWYEAEQDFLQHGYYGLAGPWREYYCQHVCEFGEICALGAMFRNAA